MVIIVLFCIRLNTPIPSTLAPLGYPSFLMLFSKVSDYEYILFTFNYCFFFIVTQIDKLLSHSQTIASFAQQPEASKYLYDLKRNFPKPKFPGARCWVFDMLMSEVMEFGKVLFKSNSLVYEAIVLMNNPIMHLFFPFEYLPQHLISTHACSQADTYWLEETQNFKKAKEIIIYDFQIFSLWLIALPMPSFLQVLLYLNGSFAIISSSSKYTFP